VEVYDHGGVRYYLDNLARALEKKYNPRAISGPDNLTGNRVDECALQPFLLVAYNTGIYWGFNYEGYNEIVSRCSGVDTTNMAFARARVKSETDLAQLSEAGHLRRVVHENVPVYFASEQLIARATNRNRPNLAG
jgi:hypothetical protein